MPSSDDKRTRGMQRTGDSRAASSPAPSAKRGGPASPLRDVGRDFDWRRYAQSRLHDHTKR